jgi:hypothetical protein
VDCRDSAFRPIACANGPEPKGVLKAWWYWVMFIILTICAISVGWAIERHGPDQDFGVDGSPNLRLVAELSGMSIRLRPSWVGGSKVCEFFLLISLQPQQ